VALPDGVVMAPVRESPYGVAPLLVAVEDGFLILASLDGRLAVERTDDGTLGPIEIKDDVEAYGVGPAASDGQRVVAFGYSEDGTGQTGWSSADGGATWTSLGPIPTDAMSSPYATQVNYVDSVAVAGDTTVAGGMRYTEIDWSAYASEVLGQDHGHGSETSSDGSGTITVQFDDGYTLTVDAATFGLTELDTAPEPIVYVHDGSTWTVVEQPTWTPGNFPVVHGPSGFAVAINLWSPDGTGPSGPHLLTSDDGLTWTPEPLPEMTGFELPSLGGGVQGYVLLGQESIAFSADGREWIMSETFPPQEPSQSVMGAVRIPAGSAAGYLVVVPDNARMTPAGWAMWSPDGLEWTIIELPIGTASVAVAVSDTVGLLMPIAEADPTDTMPTMPADEEALVAMVASAFDGTAVAPDGQPYGAPAYLTSDEARCVADGVIAELGADRVREMRFGLFPWHLLGYAMSLEIEEDDAAAIVRTFRDCSPHWEELAIRTATEGADQMSVESARCTAGLLDDDGSADVVEFELVRPDLDDPTVTLDPAYLEPLFAALEECLTDAELNALDWN